MQTPKSSQRVDIDDLFIEDLFTDLLKVIFETFALLLQFSLRSLASCFEYFYTSKEQFSKSLFKKGSNFFDSMLPLSWR